MDLFRSVIDKNKFSALTGCKSQIFTHPPIFAVPKVRKFSGKLFAASQCAEFVFVNCWNEKFDVGFGQYLVFVYVHSNRMRWIKKQICIKEFLLVQTGQITSNKNVTNLLTKDNFMRRYWVSSLLRKFKHELIFPVPRKFLYLHLIHLWSYIPSIEIWLLVTVFPHIFSSLE